MTSQTTDQLALSLLQTGLLQFGHFVEADTERSWKLNTALLPSYPDVLWQLGQMGQQHITNMTIDRLLSRKGDTQHVAQAMSFASRVPLVYHGRDTGNPVLDLVGAYDVGHPTCLIVNDAATSLADGSLLAEASRVGLDVIAIIAIYTTGLPLSSDKPVHLLLHIPAMARALATSGHIPARLADLVLADF